MIGIMTEKTKAIGKGGGEGDEAEKGDKQICKISQLNTTDLPILANFFLILD